MHNKEHHLSQGDFSRENKKNVNDLSRLDPKFHEAFDQYPWLASDLEKLLERSPWKYDHTVRVTQIGLALARTAGLSDEAQMTFTIGASLHDIAMVDDDMVELTNSTVSLKGEPLRFLIEEHPRRAAERYREHHPDASLLIGAHSKKPSEVDVPESLRELHGILYLADQIDARMSNRPYRSVSETQQTFEVIAALSQEYPETMIQGGIFIHQAIYPKAAPIPHAA